MAKTVTVAIAGFSYSPNPVEIEVGDAVQWVNQNVTKHNATRDAAPSFNTGLLPKDATSVPVTFTFPSDESGFEYTCTPHPSMKGRIVVKKVAEPPPADCE